MKSWYSASELMGLPGLPGSKRGVLDVAKRSDWAHRPRAGRGGGKEYAIASLPAVTQQHLVRRGFPAITDFDAGFAYRNKLVENLLSQCAIANSTRQRRAPLDVCRVLLGVVLSWTGRRLLSAGQSLLNEERAS